MSQQAWNLVGTLLTLIDLAHTGNKQIKYHYLSSKMGWHQI